MCLEDTPTLPGVCIKYSKCLVCFSFNMFEGDEMTLYVMHHFLTQCLQKIYGITRRSFPFTSATWPYCRLNFRGLVFSKVDRWPSIFFLVDRLLNAHGNAWAQMRLKSKCLGNINRELKHQTFLTTRTAEKPRKTGSRPLFLVRNRKVKQSTFLRHGLLPVLTFLR